MDHSNLCRRKAAAKYVNDKTGFCTPGTLAKLATIGGGPKFRYLSRYPVYTTPDLDAWIESLLSGKVASTSERITRKTELPVAAESGEAA